MRQTMKKKVAALRQNRQQALAIMLSSFAKSERQIWPEIQVDCKEKLVLQAFFLAEARWAHPGFQTFPLDRLIQQ